MVQIPPKRGKDGTPYKTDHPLKCTQQADEFLHLIQEMATRPQKYISSTGQVTTNSIEGFLALVYRGKRIDLHHTHYTCKTNMAICHKDIGPLWKLACLWSMGVDVPQCAVIATYHEGAQTLEEAAGEKTYRDLS
ncbi:uncharacterized protein [Dysidea avara]|uniref:uncharacterized protein n=1 Tax=Dysidea avara TaxID=196820 RepID=UPI00332A7D24